MVDVKSEIIINLPKEKVAEYVSDPCNAPQWCAHIKSVEWEQHASLKAGAKIVISEHIMRRHLRQVYEVIEVIPNQKVVVKTRNNNMRMETTIGWKAIDENTTCMIVWNRGIPRRISKIITPLMALVVRSTSRKSLKLLKRKLETTNRRMMVL